MKKKRVLGGVFLLFLIFATIWIVRFRGTTTLRTAEGAIFGTTYHIKYYGLHCVKLTGPTQKKVSKQDCRAIPLIFAKNLSRKNF